MKTKQDKKNKAIYVIKHEGEFAQVWIKDENPLGILLQVTISSDGNIRIIDYNHGQVTIKTASKVKVIDFKENVRGDIQ